MQSFIDQARELLAEEAPANMFILRGFAQHPDWPDMETVFGVRAGAIAVYPMYRGPAKLVGMHVLETGEHLLPACQAD